MIELIDLRKHYGTQTVLHGLNACFEAGRVHGIVGENGAGKSTLFRCIAGLEAFQGSIRSQVQPLRHRLGFLPTEPFFFEKMTGYEYLTLLCRARGVAVVPFQAIDPFGLPLQRYASEYSTGMKKKLALLGLLLQHNEVFLLDEPFNGVDIQSNLLLVQIIDRLRQSGKTVLLSSHIFASLRQTCDHIFYLRQGLLGPAIGPQDYDRLEDELRHAAQQTQLDALFAHLDGY